MVVSFGRHEIVRLLPFFLYPVIIFTFAELPATPILKRILIVEPFIVGIGILNLLFERRTFIFNGISLSIGWITLLSVAIKCGLTVAAAFLLIATTGMDGIATALRMLKIPKFFVLQLLLTYRYISVLTEEVTRMLRAYAMRSPLRRGIHRSDWGSFAGQLILRTFDRAQRVYQAMRIRGFTGEYDAGERIGVKAGDFIYLSGWIIFFITARIYNIPVLIGSVLTGVVK